MATKHEAKEKKRLLTQRTPPPHLSTLNNGKAVHTDRWYLCTLESADHLSYSFRSVWSVMTGGLLL